MDEWGRPQVFMRKFTGGNYGESRWVATLVLVVLGLKLLLLVWLGPLFPPDAAGYVGYADMILAGRANDVGLNQVAEPLLLFRIAGYSMVLAATKLLAGDHLQWLTVGLQLVCSLAATLAVYRLGRHCGLSPRLAAAAAAVPALSLPLQLDMAILSDSLYSSLMILASCWLAEGVMGTRPLGRGRALAAGVALALAFLLREATVFLLGGLVPLVSFWLYLERRLPRARRLAVVLALILPFCTTYLAYREWNRYRVGEPVITTGAQTTTFQALLQVAPHDPDFWRPDGIVDRAALQSFRTGDLGEVTDLNQVLFKKYGMNALQISRAGYAKYFESWRDHPLRMLLRLQLSNMRPHYAALWFQPAETLRDIFAWAGDPSRYLPGWRAVGTDRSKRWAVPVLIGGMLCNAASMVVFAGFFFLTPYRLFHENDNLRYRLLAAGLWCLFGAFLGIYGSVHIESRYLAPVVPLSSLVGILNLVWLSGRFSFHRDSQGQTA